MSKPRPKQYYSLRSFFTYMAKYKARMIVVGLSFVVANVLIALIPVYIGKLVGALAVSPPDNDQVIFYVVVLIVLSTGHDIFWRGSELLYRHFLNPVVIAYENVLFRRTIHKPYPYFVDKFTGKISSYITTIGQETRELMEHIYWDYLDQSIRLVSIVAIFLAVNWQTGLIFSVGLLLMFVIGRFTIRNSIKYEKHWTDVQSTKNGKIIDAVANFVNVKSFKKEGSETAAIEVEQTKNIKAANTSFLWGIVFWGSMATIIRSLIWPITIIFNVYLFLEGQLSLADIATILSTLLVFSTNIWEVIWNISQFSLRMARIEEAHVYLFGKVNIMRQQQNPHQAGAISQTFTKDLSFDNLSFAYPDQPNVPVLHSIDLQIRKGEKVGVVGHSGSGKTTLTKLLLDYYPITAGIKLDGKPVNTDSLARLISYVPQDTSLFHRSIADNIAYATDKPVSRDEVIHAARQAHADEFIATIAGGYDALVGERGVKLSAGQRQRIAIARAFLDDKPILILDEATSALDSESEILIQQALEDLWQHKTVIAIAHRLSTLRHMDRILVMDKGRIIEQGTHAGLLDANGHYAKLWAHQSGGFIDE